MNKDNAAKAKEYFDSLSFEEQEKERDNILSFKNVLKMYMSYLDELEYLEEKSKKVANGEEQFTPEETERIYKLMFELDKIGSNYERRKDVQEYALKFYILAFRANALEFRFVSQSQETLKDYEICFDVICRVAIRLNIPLFSKKIVEYTEGFLVDILNMIYAYKDHEQETISFTSLFIEKLLVCLNNGGRNTDIESNFIADIDNILKTVPTIYVNENNNSTIALLTVLLLTITLHAEQCIVTRDTLPIYFDYIKDQLLQTTFLNKNAARFVLQPVMDMINDKRSALVIAGVPESDIAAVIKFIGDNLYE